MSEFSRKVNIYVDSGNAQAVYDRLVVSQRKLTAEIQRYKDSGKDIPSTVTSKLDGVNKQLETQSKIISGALSPSLKDLKSTYSNLARELAGMRK